MDDIVKNMLQKESATIENIPEVFAQADEFETDDAFSYEGYQIVRGEFFAHINEPSFTFNRCRVSVNTACVNKLTEIDYVQILVNPTEKKLVVRPCGEDVKDSYLWSKWNNKSGKKVPRAITCKVFTAMIMELMNWVPEHRYKILGKMIQSNGEKILVFDLPSAEVYQRIATDEGKLRSSRTPIFPADWKNQFGLSVEEHKKSLQINIIEGYAVFGLGSKKENQSKSSENITVAKEETANVNGEDY